MRERFDDDGLWELRLGSIRARYDGAQYHAGHTEMHRAQHIVLARQD